MILILLGILCAQIREEPRNYNCYDKSPYKCRKCSKNCKWRYIVEKFEELEKRRKIKDELSIISAVIRKDIKNLNIGLLNTLMSNLINRKYIYRIIEEDE